MTVDNPRPSVRRQRRKVYSAPALEKGLDILERLAGEEAGMNVTQIAATLGRTVGEVFRMVAVLEQRGYIRARTDSDTFDLTLKLFELAHRIAPVARLGNAAAPVLKELSHTIGQSCHVVTYYDGVGHVVVQQDAPSERVLSVRLGARAPLLDTCSGHLLLAFANRLERARMVREIPRDQRKPKRGELASLVERVRAQGCETMKSPQVHGVEDIGFPVFDHTGEIAAAVVVPFLGYLDDSHPIGFEEAKRHTRRAAEALARALGHAPDPAGTRTGGSLEPR